jgi:hypothetical protein
MKVIIFGVLQLFLYLLVEATGLGPGISLQSRISALAELTGLTFNAAPPSKPNPSQRAVNYALYNIQLDGRNSKNWEQFLIRGQLMITDGITTSGVTNGLNPVDMLISVGSPAANPQAGSIWYSSNRYLYRLRAGTQAEAAIDYAYVTSAPGKLNVTVDSKLASSNALSQFNARSGMLANVYLVVGGSFNLKVGNSVSGSIELVGTSYPPLPKSRQHNRYILAATTPFSALVSGTLLEKGSRVI